MAWTVFPSPLGPLTAAADRGALCGLWMAGQKYEGTPAGAPGLPSEDPTLAALAQWLGCYFSGRDPGPFPAPLAPVGTAFQHRVWDALREIPWGRTVTYGSLAARLGSSPRAVGSAVGRNPISIVIPCHRVVGAGGQLTGYAGGLERKALLLALEKGSPD